MIAQVAGIIAGTIDQRRFAAAQERGPHQIHSRERDHSAIVADHTLPIENGLMEPRIVGPVARRPDDRLDFSAREVKAKWRSFLDMSGR